MTLRILILKLKSLKSHSIGLLMCLLSYKWQIFASNALRRPFKFPIVFSDFFIKNAIDFENSFFFKSKWIVLIEMKCS